MSGAGTERRLFDRAREIYDFYLGDGGRNPAVPSDRDRDSDDARLRLFRRSLLRAMDGMSASERDAIRRSWDERGFRNEAQFIEYCRGFDPSFPPPSAARKRSCLLSADAGRGM